MPPKPVSIEAAKTHREAMKVRRIQEATAEEKGLPNGWEGVEADTSFDYDQWVVANAEPFKFSCSPLDLSELGPGVVLYFDLVKYLGVLTFCFAVRPIFARPFCCILESRNVGLSARDCVDIDDYIDPKSPFESEDRTYKTSNYFHFH